MLQIGRYSYRGTGAVMVAGPLGVALVPPEWAKGAREALIGRAEIVAWLTQVSQAGADAAVLDLAGPQAHLSLLGRAWEPFERMSVLARPFIKFRKSWRHFAYLSVVIFRISHKVFDYHEILSIYFPLC